MNNSYPIIHYRISMGSPAERVDAILAAVKMVEKNKTKDINLIAAVDTLEQTLRDQGENDDVESWKMCRSAERDVLSAFEAVKKGDATRRPRLTNAKVIEIKIKLEEGYLRNGDPFFFLKPQRYWRKGIAKGIASEALVRPGFRSAVVTWSGIDPLDPDLTTSKEFTKSEVESWRK